MRRTLITMGLASLLGACTNYVSDYEKAVYDREPLYCYQTIGGVECHKEPKHRDEKRLVNYFGPAPSRYEKPAPAPKPLHSSPPPVDFWVRDAEPVPRPAPPRRTARTEWQVRNAAQPVSALQATPELPATAVLTVPDTVAATVQVSAE